MAEINTFLYSNISKVMLSNNKKHQFAMMHALVLYRQSAIYTFIPKNGCSTMRLSLAINNGTIKGAEDIDWIHQNNATFSASLKDAVTCEYSFVILRCPFKRLVSVFLDKFVNKAQLINRYIKMTGNELDINDVTFKHFIKNLQNIKILNSNIHWRPQVDFLLYDEYSDYFQLENFKHASSILKEKINFEVKDARALTNHGVDGYKRN